MVYTTDLSIIVLIKIHFDWNASNMPSICMTNNLMTQSNIVLVEQLPTMQTWMEKKEDTSKFNTRKKPLEKLKEKKKKQRATSKELKKHKEKEVSERNEKNYYN